MERKSMGATGLSCEWGEQLILRTFADSDGAWNGGRMCAGHGSAKNSLFRLEVPQHYKTI